MKYYELSMIHILCRFLSQWNWFISAATFFFFPSLWFMSYKLRWTVFGFVVHIIFLSPINNNGDRSGVKNKSLMQWA